MDREKEIHSLIQIIAFEVLQHIREVEKSYDDGWVPAADIKNSLNLNFVAVPKENEPRGEKGWFFSIIARILEDKGLVEFRKEGNRSYYRSSRDDEKNT